jgi:hypothetical protein
MQFSEAGPYYYWWSNQFSAAFPELPIEMNLNGKKVMICGYSTNYYLEEIFWDDKTIVGKTDRHPYYIIKNISEKMDNDNKNDDLSMINQQLGSICLQEI